MSNVSNENSEDRNISLECLKPENIDIVQVSDFLKQEFPRLFNRKYFSKLKKDEINNIFGGFNKLMLKNFRILQWEIQSRDFIEEARRSYRVRYNVATETLLPDKDADLLPGCCPPVDISNLINISRTSWLNKFRIKDVRNKSSYEEEMRKNTNNITKASSSFRRLLKVAHHLNLWGFDDILETINKEIDDDAKNKKEERNEMLVSYSLTIPDGELTFFTLLWLLRRMRRCSKECNETEQATWLRGENTDSCPHIWFVPNEKKSVSWWRPIQLSEFAHLNGLLICVSEKDDKYVLTERWFSMIKWLREWYKHAHNRNDEGWPLKVLKKEKGESVNTDYGNKLAKAIGKYFRSKELKFFLNKQRDGDVGEIGIKKIGEEHFSKFVECLSPLLKNEVNNEKVEYLKDPVLKKEEIKHEEWPSKDYALFRLARVQLLPAEFLLRIYQPYPLHLFVLTFNLTERDPRTNQSPATKRRFLVPSSMCFATVVGEIPKEFEFNAIKEIHEKAESDVFKWRAPYNMLFSSMSTHFSLEKTRDDALLIGKNIGKEMVRNINYAAIVHEAKEFIKMIDKGAPRTILAEVQTYFSTLYAVSPDKAEDYYDKYLQGKNELKEFLVHATNKAFLLLYVQLWWKHKHQQYVIEKEKYKAGEKGKCSEVEEKEEMELRRYLEGKVNSRSEEIFEKGFGLLKDVTIEKVKKEHQWYFFCALVSVMRNIIKHSALIWQSGKKGTVRCELVNEQNILYIFNEVDFVNVDLDNNGLAVVKEEGTESVIKDYVMRYSNKEYENVRFIENIEKVRDGRFIFRTTIPLPDIKGKE